MQFLVFAAFAIVLSVPEDGPPWATITSQAGTWAMVLGQMVLVAAAGAVCTRLVKARLERDPAWLPSAQRRLGQGNAAVRAILLAGLITSVYGTQWVQMVRSWRVRLPGYGAVPVQSIWGLDELLVLLPFFIAIVVAWVALYPADRAIRQVAVELRLWASVPPRPVWRLRQFLSFNLRQHVLIILIPMIPIVIANDFAFAYRREIQRATGLAWADQVVLVVMAGIVFVLAPVVLRYIWHTRILPPGELRDRLEELCRRIGLKYRRILIWESDGMVINAAVMGLLRPVRYILLSDGLLEMMDDQKIEAVFGHEAGHVKHRHIEFYLLFAVFSMLIVGGVFELVRVAAMYWPALFPQGRELYDYLQVGAVGTIILVWGIGFGFISRRFEWQADLFGARTVTPSPEACDQPCFLHGTALRQPVVMMPDGGNGIDPVESAVANSPTSVIRYAPSENAVCATAAGVFAEALHRIAVLNGIAVDARSWRHSSIANRMRLLKQYAHDPAGSARLERVVIVIKMLLVVGTVIGLGVGVWLYWPR